MEPREISWRVLQWKKAVHKGSSLRSMVPDDRKIWVVSGHLITSLHYGFHYFSLLVISLEGQKSVVKNLLKVILSLSIKYNVNFLRPCLCAVGERPWTGREITWASQEKFNWCLHRLLALWVCSLVSKQFDG